MRAHRRLLVASVVGASAAAGCAGPSVLPGHSSSPSAFERSVDVIKGWSTALRTGHVRAAATYFHIPSVWVNGPQDEFVLHNLAAVEVVNRLLPCGAEYISATQRGPYINALFRLTDRSGPGGGPHSCGSGAGTTARVEFIISGGQITHWLRAPSQPGDNRTTPPGAGTSSSPRATTAPQTGTATSPGTNTVPPGTQTSPVPPRTSTQPTPTTPPQTATSSAPKV
jgi:hypothetical protein